MKSFIEIKKELEKNEIKEIKYDDNIIIYDKKVKYIDKISFINTIKDIIIADENNITEMINDNLAFKLLDYLILNEYTNLKDILCIKEDEETLENILMILDYIGLPEIKSLKEHIQIQNPLEIDELEMMLEKSLQEIKELRRIKNSSIYQIVDFLQNLSFDNIEQLKPLLEKMKDFNNMER